MSLTFLPLEDDQVERAFQILLRVGEWLKQKGRRQRISKTSLGTYQQWQVAACNFVVVERSEIVGLVTLAREPLLEWSDFDSKVPVPMIRGLATDPDHQGKGVGAFALNNAIELCKDKDAAIFLDCVSEFLPKYYSRFGFESIAQQVRTYPDDPEPYAITLMRRD